MLHCYPAGGVLHPSIVAIEAGDEQTGVCIMQMEVYAWIRAPVYHCLATPVGSMDTAGVLHDRLADMGAEALRQCIEMA